MADEFNPNPSLGDRLEALEKSLRGFGRTTRSELIMAASRLQLKDRAALVSRIRYVERSGQIKVQREKPLVESIGSSIRKRGGDIDGVAFSFARHGIFLEHGVGKHRPKGSPAAARLRAKIGAPWLAPTLDGAVEKLADLLAEEYADIVAAEVVIKIPGVIDTSIK